MFILFWATSICCLATEIFRQVAQGLSKYLRICPALRTVIFGQIFASIFKEKEDAKHQILLRVQSSYKKSYMLHLLLESLIC
jgi:hypothetical protein